MAMKSRLVYTVAVLGGVWSAPALAQEAPLPDRPANLSLTPPALVRHRSPAGGSPLFVVNGVVQPTSAVVLDHPTDIESIDVLKPPASVERYGEAARHGAVLIRLRPSATVAFRQSQGPAWSLHGHYETCLPLLGPEPGTRAGEHCVRVAPRPFVPGGGIRIRGSRLAATP